MIFLPDQGGPFFCRSAAPGADPGAVGTCPVMKLETKDRREFQELRGTSAPVTWLEGMAPLHPLRLNTPWGHSITLNSQNGGPGGGRSHSSPGLGQLFPSMRSAFSGGSCGRGGSLPSPRPPRARSSPSGCSPSGLALPPDAAMAVILQEATRTAKCWSLQPHQNNR